MIDLAFCPCGASVVLRGGVSLTPLASIVHDAPSSSANQLVRSSGPSTESTKSFCALICRSQLIGGESSEAPIAAFLNISLQSGLGGSPERDLMRPSRNSH